MKYSDFSLKTKNSKTFYSNWAYKEGVFETPQGKYIARVRIRSNFTTLSQHDTESEAKAIYDNYNLKRTSGDSVD